MSKVVVCRVVLLTLVLVAVLGAHASAFTDPACFKDVVKCFEDSANLRRRVDDRSAGGT